MNKKGFSLIEMIGVITLLGLIAVITVPTIKEVLDDSKQNLYEEQIHQIESGLKNWASSNTFLLPEEETTITLSLGQLKQLGYLEPKIKNPKTNKCFSNDSLLTITKHNNSYIYEVNNLIDTDCSLIENAPIIKLNGNEVIYLNIGDTYVEEGASAKDSNGNDISSNIVTTISNGGTIDTTTTGTYTIAYNITNDNKTMIIYRTVIIKPFKNGIMSSSSNCINEGTCEAGTFINVQVNPTQDYNFYVINDSNDVLTLIMDRNLGDDVKWISADDYTTANTDSSTCDYAACNDEGPITAVATLKERTSGWTNIPEMQYTYSDDKSRNKYVAFTETMRARMITYTEATTLGCKWGVAKSCPSWLYINLYNTGDNNTFGYWLTSTSSNNTYDANRVASSGRLADYWSYDSSETGIRPVILLEK